jgi:hypothetical protein
MPRKADPQERARRKWIHYGLFFLGVFILVAGIVLFFPALQYEFEQGTSGGDAGSRVYEYEMLTPQEQRIVDGALNGKTYMLETSKPLPGASTPGFEPRNVRVNKQGTTYTFTYRAVFPETAPKGMATITLVVGGLLAMGEAVRRHHFPQSLPWQTS